MRLRTGLVAPLLFGSGFCALIYQTTWLREFRLIFGASTAATAAVIGVFMAGLGFGGIILGRRSETKARPLAFYAWLELGIAVSVAITPLLILWARYFYVALGGTQTMGMLLGTIVRLVFSALILATPTFLMGGTLPAAARAVVRREDISRRSIGVLYGVNTLGAVTGAMLATFYFFEHWGNHATLWFATALNVAVALTAFYLSRPSRDAQPILESAEEPAAELAESRAITNPIFVLIAAAIVGFAFFLMELVWYRMLGSLLGGTAFAFGLILAAALLGIGLGGTAYALFDLKRSVSLHFFALTCAVEAFFIALPYALGDRIAIAAMLLHPLGVLGFQGHVIAWTAICMLVVFPAALVAGVQFPLLIALLGEGRNRVGSQTGMAYAWNTAGSLLGSLAGGFGFIPLFSAPGVWRIVIVLLCALSVAAAFLAWRPRRHWFWVSAPVAAATLALLMLLATGPTAFWRHGQIGVGRLKFFQVSSNQVRDLMQKVRRSISWEADGIESSVAIASDDSLSFIINGRNDGNSKRDAGTQVMCGLIGAAVHPHPRKALVVGLGTGSTAGWLAAVPTMERVDVAELEPAILNVAKKCAPVNHDALANPKLHIIIGDARELLLTTAEKYDLIASEPSNPYRAGVAGLFTREFYQSVANRLEPGGMFSQWMQAYEVDERTIQIVYRTIGSVFPNIESWATTEGDLLLVASREPVSCDVETLRTRLAQEPFVSALRSVWRANGLEDFVAHYIGNEAVAETFQHLGPAPLNTDDRTVIEFAFARSVDLLNAFSLPTLKVGSHAAQADRPLLVGGEVDWSRVEEGWLSLYASLSQTAQATAALNTGQEKRAAAFVSYERGDLADALRNWKGQFDEPKTLSQLTLVAECLAADGDATARQYIEGLAEVLPWDAEAIRARLLWKQNKIEEASASLDKVFHALRDDPWPARHLIQHSILVAREIAKADKSRLAAIQLYNSLRLPFSVFNNEDDRLVQLVNIGMLVEAGELGEYTRAAIQAIEPNIPWQREFLNTRNNCYAAVKSPLARQASRDLDEFLQHEVAPADAATLSKKIEGHVARQHFYPGPSQNAEAPQSK
jgi:spermidine synthase